MGEMITPPDNPTTPATTAPATPSAIEAQREFHEAFALPPKGMSAAEWRKKMDRAAEKLPHLVPGSLEWKIRLAEYWDTDEEAFG